MGVNKATQRWLAPLARSDNDWSASDSAITPDLTSTSSELQSPTSGSSATSITRAKRKHVSTCVDPHDMARDGFRCCYGLRCVDSFVGGKGDIATLRAEQQAMSKLTGAARASFVHTLTPLLKPARNKGSMVAGHQLVCTRFFKQAFGVSNNMIQTLKNNAGSPALKG